MAYPLLWGTLILNQHDIPPPLSGRPAVFFSDSSLLSLQCSDEVLAMLALTAPNATALVVSVKNLQLTISPCQSEYIHCQNLSGQAHLVLADPITWRPFPTD